MLKKISRFSPLISHLQAGQSLVELLVAIGVAAILLPALITGLVTSREGKVQQIQRQTATALVEEAKEATRSVRERGWVAFAVNGAYKPVVSGSQWTLSTAPPIPEQINNYARQIVISDAFRDASGNIASSGTVDPSTKKVVITVSWPSPIPSAVASTTYMTRYLDNDAFVDTTQTDFNAGTQASVKVQPTGGSLLPDDGEIVLSQTGGFGDWCTPVLTFEDEDLPKSGVANAVSAIQGLVAAGTGDNASGVSYANVTITDPAYPAAPDANVAGTFDGFKTNGVFTEPDFAYLATDNNFKEIVIINLNNQVNGKYTEEGYFDAPGNGNGNSIFTAGTVGYMTSGDKFFTFDLTSHTGSRTRLNDIAGLALSGTGNKIFVVGSTAYVATSSTTNQLQIINVADPANPTISGSITVNGQGANDVFINIPQNRAYLVTSQSASKPEFFLISLINNSVLGTYDTATHGDMNPKGVVAVSGAKAIIVGTGGEEYQALSLSTESNPSYCGGLNIDSGVNGIATVFTAAQRAYSYIITGDANAELKIIEGGPGGAGGSYVPVGTFTSRPFGPTTFDSAFNRFIASVNQPVANGVQILVGVADAVSGACTGANYTFVGVNGSAAPFQTSTTGTTTIAGLIPLGTVNPSYINPGKCFKYKATLNTTDPTLTPVFNDMTINYSP